MYYVHFEQIYGFKSYTKIYLKLYLRTDCTTKAKKLSLQIMAN